MKTFRISVAGGIDAVTDLAMSDGRHVLYMENLDVRSTKAVPVKSPEVNPNIIPPTGSVQVFSYRGRILFNTPGRRAYAAEYYGNRERIYWTQYGGDPQKMIDGTVVPLGTIRPASPTVSEGDAISPANITVAVTTGGGLPASQTISFRLAYNTVHGVLPACGAVLVTLGETAGAMITLSWSNPVTDIPATEIWIFVGHGNGDEQFLTAVGANATQYVYTSLQAATGAPATQYDQSISYQYCVTYLRSVHGVENESGPSAPTPLYQSTFARSVTMDPWSEGLMGSDNLVSWGANQPAFQLLDVTHIPGNQSSALTVSSIVRDPFTGNVVATFTDAHSFHDKERIYIVGCSPDPFLNPNLTEVADSTARDAIDPGSRVIGMLVQTLDDLKVWQLQGGIENADWHDVTGTPSADLPVEIQVSDAAEFGMAMFDSCVLNVSSDFVAPGTGLAGVTAYRIASVGISTMDFNPQSGVLDIYTTEPHSFGTEKVTFAGFTDPAWNNTIKAIHDPTNPLRLFVEDMTLPSDAVTGFSACSISKVLTAISYDLAGGSLVYAATAKTQFGTNTEVGYATVTASAVSGATGPQGSGINETITFENGTSTGACPVLGDVLYLNMTTTATVKQAARVVGTPARGLLLNQAIAGATGATGPAYAAGIDFIPYNDFITKRRVYRVGGTTSFQRVAELNLDDISILDATPDSGLGEVLPTWYTQDDVDVLFEPAPFGLNGLTPHYKMLFAWDPSSNELRWTPEGQYDAWPAEFFMGFDYRILGLISFNHALCVFCEDGIYRMDGASSTGLIRNKTKAAGCRAGGTVQIINNRVIYLTDQGISEFDGQNSECLTDLKIPSEFWMGTSRYLESSDPGQALVPFTQNAAFDRLAGATLPAVTPRYLEPYRVDPRHYMDAQGALRSFVLFGKYYLYWGSDFPAYAAQTMVCIDFSAPGSPIGIIGLKAVDAFVDELNQVHMILRGIAAPTTPVVSGPTSITLVPTSFALTAGEEATIVAIITGQQNVTWSVDGIENGNSTVGTLTGSGNSVTYHAPATAGEHTISCASSVDGAISAVSTVSVTLASAVAVAVSPSIVSLLAGAQTTLSAAVSGSSNTAVAWDVDGVVGGNSTVGTISSAGIYTAPATTGSHTITATSQADATKSASAAVTVTDVPVVAVSVTPGSATVNQGGTLALSAAVSGTSNTAVTWLVDGIAGGNSTVGTVSTSGLYAAPAASGGHTVTAKSVADTSKTASCSITVPAVSVAISPTSRSMTANTPASFTATVSGAANTAVTWWVDGIAGGNSTVGTVTSTGVYTAPASAGSHSVTAKSVADATKSATSAVTVTAASTGVTLAMTPADPTAVGSGGTIQFAATVGGATDTTVAWAVDGVAGGNSTVGTIDGTGLYTAPTTTIPTIRTVTCTSNANPAISATLRIMTVASNTRYNAHTSGGAVGNGTTDDTAAINASLASAAGGICYLPDTATHEYLINATANSTYGIDIPANTCLLMDPGTTLKCKTQTTSGQYRVVRIANTNAVIVGGKVVGDRVARNLPNFINGSGTDFENGDGIDINGAGGGLHMQVLGTKVSNCCNDGFYIYNGANGVILSDVGSDGNRRQGLSVVSGSTGKAQYSSFTNTHGQDPGCGVDIEPTTGASVTGFVLDHCTVTGNAGGGVAGGPPMRYGPTGDNTAHVTTCRVSYCTITGNGGSNYHGGGVSWDESDSITLDHNNISNNYDHGVKIYASFTNGVLSGNTITGNQGDGLAIGGETSMSNECGGTQVHGNTISGNTGRQIYNAPNSGAIIGSNP